MNVIHIVLVLVIIGVILWLINYIIPMVEWVRILINCLVGLFVLLWLLGAMGLDTGLDLRLR